MKEHVKRIPRALITNNIIVFGLSEDCMNDRMRVSIILVFFNLFFHLWSPFDLKKHAHYHNKILEKKLKMMTGIMMDEQHQ